MYALLTRKCLVVAVVVAMIVLMAVIGALRPAFSKDSGDTDAEITTTQTTHAAKEPHITERQAKLREHWEVKDDGTLTEESAQILHTFQYGNHDELVDAVGEACDMEDNAQRIKIASEGLKLIADRDLRRDLVSSVSRLGTKRVLPVVKNALRDPDPFVRSQALVAVSQFANFRDQELLDWVAEKNAMEEGEDAEELTEEEEEALENEELEEKLKEIDEYLTEEEWDELTLALKEAFCDEDASVREDALDTLRELNDYFRYNSMLAALQSPYGEIQEEAVRLAGDERTKDGFNVLLQGLDSTNEEVRSKAMEYVSDMTGEEFSNGSQAKSWWQEHQEDFDEDMVQSQESLEE